MWDDRPWQGRYGTDPPTWSKRSSSWYGLDAEAPGWTEEFEHIRAICQRGTPADRQLAPSTRPQVGDQPPGMGSKSMPNSALPRCSSISGALKMMAVCANRSRYILS